MAEALLATVVIVEEFAPENRAWGIGAAAAMQACGSGFAALMFGFVDVLPFGWRALYAVGVIPLCSSRIGGARCPKPVSSRISRMRARR